MQGDNLQTTSNVQAPVIVHQDNVELPWVVGGAAEHVPDALRLLVLVRLVRACRLRAQQDGLPPPERCLVVLGRGVHVALRQVVQLADCRVRDNVALLLRRAVVDAQRPDDRLL